MKQTYFLLRISLLIMTTGCRTQREVINRQPRIQYELTLVYQEQWAQYLKLPHRRHEVIYRTWSLEDAEHWQQNYLAQGVVTELHRKGQRP